LAKTDNNSLVLQCSKVSIGDLLTRVYQRFLPKCQRENILLHLATDPALPTIELDEARMTQVLGNLMDNAIRHTPEQGSIRLSASASETECEIVVSDTGEGIDPSQLSQVFERFYRAENSRTSVEGNSGLGLSICRALLEMQGATIRVESDGKTGSRFYIQIPRT
jgi:signal transduction histidine kinase